MYFLAVISDSFDIGVAPEDVTAHVVGTALEVVHGIVDRHQGAVGHHQDIVVHLRDDIVTAPLYPAVDITHPLHTEARDGGNQGGNIS